jgi:hypothetical protein
MNRLRATNTVNFAGRDIAPNTGTPQYATNGNPGVTSPTIFPAYSWNMVQDEICQVILAAGLTLDDTNRGQLAQAIALLIANGTRVRLNNQLTLFVATTGSDTLGTGLSSGSPFATLQHAYNYLQNNFDLNGFTATINIAPGTYAPVICAGPIMGQNANNVIFNGSIAAPNTVIIQASNAAGFGLCFYVYDNAWIFIQGVTLQTSGTQAEQGNCLATNFGGSIVFTTVIFGTAIATHCYAGTGGFIQAAGNYTVSGGSANHITAGEGGHIHWDGSVTPIAITLVGTPNFSGSFASAGNCGTVWVLGTTFIGTGATGTRYAAANNGSIATNGAGANFFPGSVAGATSSGGQYS